MPDSARRYIGDSRFGGPSAASAERRPLSMSWETIYLVCFLIGFLLSLISLLAGNPHLHFHGFHHAHAGTHAAPLLNLGTVSAFFAWFGGTGYLLTRYSAVQFALVM